MLSNQQVSSSRSWILACASVLLWALASNPAAGQDLVWAKSAHGFGIKNGIQTVVDGAGNVYTIGEFNHIVDFDPSPSTDYLLTSAGDFDAYIWKLDAGGGFGWAKRVGGSGHDYCRALALDAAGNLYVSGTFTGTVDFDPDPSGTYNLTTSSVGAYLLKLDPQGSFLWAKGFGGQDMNIDAIALDPSGNVYLTGAFYGIDDFDPDPARTYNLHSSSTYDIFVLKLDAAGTFRWAQRAGGTNFLNRSFGRSIAVDPSGASVYVTGLFQGTTIFPTGPLTAVGGGQDAFIMNLPANGPGGWAKALGGSGNDSGSSVTVDGAGNIYVTGTFQGTADLDPSPDSTYPLTSAGSYDAFVLKLDPGSTFLWARSLGGALWDSGGSLVVDRAGGVYVMGYFQGTADFDPDPVSAYVLTSSGDYDVFFANLDRSGNLVWARRVGGPGTEFSGSIALDASGSLYAAGWFQRTADFDPDPAASYNLTTDNWDDSDVFVSKLSQCSKPLEPDTYGRLLFAPRCAEDASAHTQDVYASSPLVLRRGPRDRFHLSSEGYRMSPLAVKDAIHVSGLDVGLGPYDYRPGVPPFRLEVPITDDLDPKPPREIDTSLIPPGDSSLLFELLETQRTILGNTAIYLVADCGIYLDKISGTWIHFVSHDDQWQNGQPASLSPEFDVRWGFLSELRADRSFDRIACFGGAFVRTPARVNLENPTAGDGYYFLVKEWSAPPGGGCFGQDYGDAGTTPDPRDALDALPECPAP